MCACGLLSQWTFDDVTRSLANGTSAQSNDRRLGGSICDAIVTPEPGSNDVSSHAAIFAGAGTRRAGRGLPAGHVGGLRPA